MNETTTESQMQFFLKKVLALFKQAPRSLEEIESKINQSMISFVYLRLETILLTLPHKYMYYVSVWILITVCNKISIFVLLVHYVLTIRNT